MYGEKIKDFSNTTTNSILQDLPLVFIEDTSVIAEPRISLPYNDDDFDGTPSPRLWRAASGGGGPSDGARDFSQATEAKAKDNPLTNYFKKVRSPKAIQKAAGESSVEVSSKASVEVSSEGAARYAGGSSKASVEGEVSSEVEVSSKARKQRKRLCEIGGDTKQVIEGKRKRQPPYKDLCVNEQARKGKRKRSTKATYKNKRRLHDAPKARAKTFSEVSPFY